MSFPTYCVYDFEGGKRKRQTDLTVLPGSQHVCMAFSIPRFSFFLPSLLPPLELSPPPLPPNILFLALAFIVQSRTWKYCLRPGLHTATMIFVLLFFNIVIAVKVKIYCSTQEALPRVK